MLLSDVTTDITGESSYAFWVLRMLKMLLTFTIPFPQKTSKNDKALQDY